MISRICSLLRMDPPIHADRGLLYSSGATVPTDGTDGYQTGCLFLHTDGGVGTALYVNEGSVTSSAFNAVEPLESITLGDLADVADAYTTRIVETGTYQSTASGGVTLSATNRRPVSWLFDDAGVALTGDTRAVLSRVLLTIATAGTVNAIRGQIKILDTIATSTNAVVSPITGYLELTGTGARTLTGHVAGLRAALEEGASGTTTIAASSYYAGLECTLNSTRTYTTTGQMAGVIVNISGGTSVWPIGVLIDSDSCTTGIEVGNCATQGILLNGTASSAQLKITGTAILSAGEQAIYINCAAETVATNGIWITLKSSVTSGDCSGIRSRITTTGASGTVNNRSVWAQSYVGASGFANVVDGVLAEVSVAAGSADTQHVACLRAHFSAGASFVNDLTFYVIHARCQTRSDETFSGSNALLGLENQAVGGNGKKLNALIEAKYTSLSAGVHAADYFIDGGVAVNLIDTAIFRFPDDGSICEASAAGTGNADGADFVGFIKVVIGTTTMYIPLLSNTPASVFT